MIGIYACDVDTIAVVGKAVNDCTCQRTVITRPSWSYHSLNSYWEQKMVEDFLRLRWSSNKPQCYFWYTGNPLFCEHTHKGSSSSGSLWRYGGLAEPCRISSGRTRTDSWEAAVKKGIPLPGIRSVGNRLFSGKGHH